jgi:hypothetical protein
MLSGGDRRSIAKSNRVRILLQKDPNLLSDVAGLANDADGLVSMRAMDLLEKLAHDHADWAQPHKRLFIGPLGDSDRWGDDGSQVAFLAATDQGHGGAATRRFRNTELCLSHRNDIESGWLVFVAHV